MCKVKLRRFNVNKIIKSQDYELRLVNKNLNKCLLNCAKD